MSTPRLDPFSRKRLEKWIGEFRAQTGQLPTRTDLEAAGFDRGKVDAAIHDKVIGESYVTLTNGVIKKGYTVLGPEPLV